MSEIDEVKQIVRDVEGYLIRKEGELLYNLAKSCKGRGVIVEIGSWKGQSTIWLAKGSKAGMNVKVYAIDPHTGSSEHKNGNTKVWTFEEFNKNIEMAEVDDIIIPIVKSSEEAAKNFNEPIELLFIDGAHEYESVKSDFECWLPKLITGGIIAVHDTVVWLGPRKVVEEYLFKSDTFKNIEFVDSITFAQKVEQNSMKDRLNSRYVLFLKDMCSFAAKLNLPAPIRIIGKEIIRRVQ